MSSYKNGRQNRITRRGSSIYRRLLFRLHLELGNLAEPDMNLHLVQGARICTFAMSLRESMKKLEAYRLEKKQRDEECRKKESEEATEKEQALLPPKPSLVSRVAARLRVDIFDILPFRMWRSFCNSNPRLCWTATFVVWAVLQCFMAWMEFGAVFFIVFLLTLMILNLGTRAEGEVSAYSVFNPGCERLLGQMTAEHFENELLRRNRRPAAASS
ncbi:hypothetical protein QR680_005687 [Steinernema hermaphroditum]|uniref:SAYSvFN domain-containing protein n=1 Tax=Steinernema hermaphroditum TaxID=289476 RepID=A0AA39LVU9_9BILA|nr:hypothetical protein QR680_005687 [Steinernema hermaphroditum]